MTCGTAARVDTQFVPRPSHVGPSAEAETDDRQLLQGVEGEPARPRRADRSGALAATVLKLAWVRSPKWLSATIAVTLGWVGVVAFSQLLKLPLWGLLLVVAGGVLYTAGAIVYARRRPDPRPHVFGYHELFHTLTLAAAGCQYTAIAFVVLPRG